MGSVRGLLLSAVGLMLFAPSVVAVFLNPKSRAADAMLIGNFRRFGPIFFLVYCLSTLLFSPGDKAFAFSPAEVSFLFPAPFSRRKLLAYKIGGNIGLTMVMAIFMTFAFRQFMTIWVAGYLGLVMAFTFLQVFAMAVTLTGQAIGERASTRRRQLALAIIVAIVGATALSVGWSAVSGITSIEALKQLENAPAVRVALAPFKPFVMMISASRLWPNLVSWGAVALAINVSLIAAILALDAQYLEAAAATSERFYAKLERMKKGSSVSSRNPNKKWKGLHSLPWWGGIGPILWRQLTVARRDYARILVAPCLSLFIAGLGIYLTTLERNAQSPIALSFAGMILGTTVLMSPLINLDFRADYERMEGLKTLPISASRLAMGQLAAPVVLLTASQLLGLLVLAIGTWPAHPAFWIIAAFTIPLNLILLEVENVMFLWFPSRPMAHTPGDIEAMGRMMIMMSAKVLVMALAGGLAAGLGFLAYFLAGWAGMAIVAWLILMGFVVAMIPLIASAFRGFDVASDVLG